MKQPNKQKQRPSLLRNNPALNLSRETHLVTQTKPVTQTPESPRLPLVL